MLCDFFGFGEFGFSREGKFGDPLFGSWMASNFALNADFGYNKTISLSRT